MGIEVDKKKVLVIGCGYWGKKLIRKFQDLGCVVYGLDKDPRAIPAGVTGVELDWESEELRNVGKVVIATPPDTHFMLTEECLEHGRSVLVEKPLAMSHSQALALANLAWRKNLTLMCDDTFSYHPGIYTNNSVYIEGFEADWGGERPEGRDISPEGIVWTLGPHPVSLMLKAMGTQCIWVDTVDCLAKKVRFLAKFVGGREAFISLNWEIREKVRSITLISRDGIIQIDASRLLHDALLDVCREFLKEGPWIDYRSVDVVRILEEVDLQCKFTSSLLQDNT